LVSIDGLIRALKKAMTIDSDKPSPPSKSSEVVFTEPVTSASHEISIKRAKEKFDAKRVRFPFISFFLSFIILLGHYGPA